MQNYCEKQRPMQWFYGTDDDIRLSRQLPIEMQQLCRILSFYKGLIVILVLSLVLVGASLACFFHV